MHSIILEMTDKIRTAVDVVWDYMQLHQQIQPADALIVLGNRDDRTATYAASLLKKGVAPICVVTGGANHVRNQVAASWQENTEADHFIGILHAAGINDGIIYKESQALNTGQNALFSYELLKSHQFQPKSILIITKPYMERRALATFEMQWPEKSVRMQAGSVGGLINDYCNETQNFEMVVNIMVGDLQRIMEYPKRGLLTTQQIPADVVDAYRLLVAAGYTEHQIDQ